MLLHSNEMKIDRLFLNMSEVAVALTGNRFALATAIALVAIWCIIGAGLDFPKKWFLLSNMFGTMATLFMMLLMQRSQNRDTHALHVKMDELIRSSEARNHMIGVERLEATELAKLATARQTDA